MRYTIDRFEGKFAILEAENDEISGVERARLPANAVEGDLLLHEAGVWRIDADATAERRALLRAKLDALWDHPE